MKFFRRRKQGMGDEYYNDRRAEPDFDFKRKKGSKKFKKEKRDRERYDSANPELAARLREYAENYGLEGDPYLDGLANAVDEGKDLAIWASNDVMTLMPHPIVSSVEGFFYSALVLMRNVLVFVPVALTWLAVGKATTGFAIYTAKNGADSIVNFLQFWQNGYGVLAKGWTLSRIAEDDFVIIGTVIILTFITPFMNRSSLKRSAHLAQEALRDRLALVIEVESFFFDKRKINPFTVDSSLARSFENIVDASHNLRVASERLQGGATHSEESIREFHTPDKKSKKSLGVPNPASRSGYRRPSYNRSAERSVVALLDSLDSISGQVDRIAQTQPLLSHSRRELRKIETELEELHVQLVALVSTSAITYHAEFASEAERGESDRLSLEEWKAQKREEERDRAFSGQKGFKKDSHFYKSDARARK